MSRLLEIERLSGWSRTNAIGELILNSFFGGQVEEWVSRAPGKGGSLRRLAAHAECPLRKSALSDAVNSHLFFQANRRVSELSFISPAHVSIALRAGETKALALLEEANLGRWSVRQLAARLRLEQPVDMGPGVAFASLAQVERRFTRTANALHDLCGCDPSELGELTSSLERIRDRLRIIGELIGANDRNSGQSERLDSEIVGLRGSVASSH